MLVERSDRGRPRRILAVASSGGHWVQLRRMAPAFADQDVAYLTTDAGHRAEVGEARFHVVNDASRWSKIGLVRCALRIGWVLLRERPHVVVSTGAAPGYIAIRLARLLRARTVWIDSIANVEELSMSGRLASATADLCLTQWPHLAVGDVRYLGAVV
jgi:UDP-N-acetylglucosamine:LPS N-acetylglucosamine transferase